jgi:hypothetical protein
MNVSLKNLSLSFSAGGLGGLINALAVWLFGLLGISAALGVQIAPELKQPFLYQKIVWGGIWGALLLIPLMRKNPWLRGLIISFAPTLVQLFIVFPFQLNKGVMGLDLGALTPVFVIFYNALWGISAAFWFHATTE